MLGQVWRDLKRTAAPSRDKPCRIITAADVFAFNFGFDPDAEPGSIVMVAS
jgi:hypothetical protein